MVPFNPPFETISAWLDARGVRVIRPLSATENIAGKTYIAVAYFDHGLRYGAICHDEQNFKKVCQKGPQAWYLIPREHLREYMPTEQYEKTEILIGALDGY